MLLAGLTGGLASGKSHVGRLLQELGCMLVEADRLGHQVLMPDGEAYQPTIDEFGPGILAPGGMIDRRKLGDEVFEHPERLARLNDLVHPLVRARCRALIDQFAVSNPHGIAVVEAAILIETGSYRDYDRLIVVICTEEQQIARAMERDGLTRKQALARLRRQLPLEEKVKLADYVIDTSGTRENTAGQTRAVYNALRSIQK